VAETLVGLTGLKQTAGERRAVIGWFCDGGVEVAADWMAVAGVQNRAGGVWWGEGGVVRYGGRKLGP
jgi:hypothetical protein